MFLTFRVEMNEFNAQNTHEPSLKSDVVAFSWFWGLSASECYPHPLPLNISPVQLMFLELKHHIIFKSLKMSFVKVSKVR